MHDTKGGAGPDRRCLFEIASGQAGYFTAQQARNCGYSRSLLSHHVKGGRFVRVRHGLYRLTEYPASRREEIIAAWLSAGADNAVISHESALDLLDLSDVVPGSIHLTVPRSERWRKRVPGTTLHTTTKPLAQDEIVIRDGLPVTAPARTIIDAAASGIGPEQITAAIAAALQRGMTTRAQLLKAAQESGRRAKSLIRRGMEEADSE
ncbi:MAG: type IV toxin-antitoxin system AbiEi family antitoxin domain-containing protein [Anaerolineales bacterium]